MKWSTLYGEWGKLLYAIAACDGKISQKERDKLQQIVRDALSEFQPTDEFGSPVPSYISASFDYAEYELIDKEDLMASFYDFIDRHKTSLTFDVLQKMIQSATKLAAASFGINKLEHQLLDDTKQVLRKLIEENHLTKTTSS